jgi:hypothetical protein
MMPRYFFDFSDGTSETDRDGTELADEASAKREAQEALAEILKEECVGGDDIRVSTRVRREDGSDVLWARAIMLTSQPGGDWRLSPSRKRKGG